MTTPRELAITEVGNELLLTTHPITELVAPFDNTFQISADRDAVIAIGAAPEQVLVKFDATTKKISIDRSSAWFDGIEDGPQISPAIDLPEFTIRTVIDHGSLELFIPEAGLAMTSLHSLPAVGAILQNSAN
jgi:hypothetical protein